MCTCANDISGEVAAKLRRLVIIAATVVAAFAAFLLMGWIFNIPELLTPTVSHVNSKSGAALGLLLGSLSLFLLAKYPCRCNSRASAAIKAMCAVMFAFGAATLFQILTGMQLGIDELIARDTTGLGSAPGRMGPNTAICLMAFGLSCGLACNANARMRYAAAWLNALVFIISLLSIMGYFYGVKDLYTIRAFTQMAFGTAVGLFALSCGRAFARMDEQPTRLFVSTTPGGYMLRRLFPIALLVPILLGAIVSELVVVRLYADALAHAIFVLSMTAILIVLSYSIAKSISERDLAKRAAALRVEELNRQLQEQVESLAEANRNLEAAKTRAESATLVKSRFIANVSHELRTPIGGIIGANDLLLQDASLRRETIDLVRTSQSCASALLILVNDLLDLSKIEFGQLPMRRAPFDAVQLIKSAMRFYLGEPRSDIALSYEADATIPTLVVGDPARIRQVLLNLISNAIKFTARGRVTVRLELGDDNGSPSLKFLVRDTGIGISEENQKLLFKPFSQIDNSPTRQYGGAGLGLSISKGLVEAMGGSIGVTSKPGEGACFWFTVPLIVAAADAEPLPPEQSAPAVLNVKRLPVLVVEDNAVIQRLVAKQLALLGLDATIASTGREALQHIINGSFSLVLMDCNLPDISGYEVTKQIRHDELGSGKRVPIVAMTAAAMPEDRERCLSADMDDYMSKPVSMDKLKQVVATWASGAEMPAEKTGAVRINRTDPDQNWVLPVNF